MDNRYALSPPSPPKGVEWKDMADAPRDGTVIVVRFDLWNNPRLGEGIQCAHWLNGEWRPPFDLNERVFAKDWATVEEVNRAMPGQKG